MQADLPGIILVLFSAAILVVTGRVQRPGIGIIATLAIVAALAFIRPEGWALFGFGAPASWGMTLLWGFLGGTVLALVALVLIEPLAERITGQPHDISIVDSVRRSKLALAQWIVIVWVFVALIEELVYRGFLMLALIAFLGLTGPAVGAALLFSSVIFGLSHAYQGPSGAISSATVGLLIGVIFVLTGFDLWLAILIHGFIDTVQLILIAANRDDAFRRWLVRTHGMLV